MIGRKLWTTWTAVFALVAGLGVSAVSADAEIATAELATAALVDPASRDGSVPDRAATSCWEIAQLHPEAPDGAYWLLTPQMSEPSRFWCDQTTDGGGWVRIGVGRQGWDTGYLGQGNPANLLVQAPAPTTMVQLPSTTVDALLNGRRVVDQVDGIRLRRAMDISGSTWQEGRFNIANRDRWVWTMGAEHRITGYSFDGVSGAGGALTSNFGADNSFRRVTTSISSNQGYTWGFAFGSQVTGTSASSTYLWSRTEGTGAARPYTEVYLRPRLTTADVDFPSIPDTGSDAVEKVAVADSVALDNRWGVNGLAGSTSAEGNVEVQAFAQIGSTMFVGGNFRYVQRDSSGTGRVDQPFLAAFDASTGEHIPGFAPRLNEQVRALAPLPNGTLAVGGTFTQVNGRSATGLVALDPGTGATTPGWGTVIENNLSAGVVNVRTLAVEGSSLYLGGAFTHLSSQDGTGRVYARAAARVSVTDGSPQVWNPEFNGTVIDLDPSEDGSKVYASGYFGSSRGAPAPRVAAVLTSGEGELDPTPWSPTWSNTNGDYQQAIDAVDGRIWVGGAEHSMFTFDPTTYERLSGNITKQHGDFQSVDSGRGQLYGGCHCNHFNYTGAYTWPNVGSAWTQADAIGWLAAWDTATGKVIPQFRPEMQMRLGSGIWATKVAADGTVWAGGDIVQGRTASGGGRWLGGFARFPAMDTTAPGRPANLRIASQTTDTVRLAWDATNGAARYHVLRDDRVVAMTSGTALTVPKSGENRFFVRAADAAGNASPSTPVLATGDGNPRPRPAIDYTADGLTVTFDASGSTDDGQVTSYSWDFGDGTTGEGVVVEHAYAVTGTYRVRLLVVDDLGAFQSTSVEVDVQLPAPTDAYGATVLEDSPYLYWRLGDADGPHFQDSSGNNRHANVTGGLTRQQEGAVVGTDDPSVRFNGVDAQGVASAAVTSPSPYSTEVWFKTQTTRGGKLIGLGNAPSGLSSNYDRHVWMQNNGQLSFGAWTGAQNVATSPISYNDGQWHHAVATQGADGMKLYVDGELVATNPQVNAEAYTGYWRIGGDRVWSGSSTHFQGDLDEVAVYSKVLTADRIAEHFSAGVTEVPNASPTAEFSVSRDGFVVSVDAAASRDPDGEIVEYLWDFGDGTSGTGVTASHEYEAEGTYEITLLVTDDEGASDSRRVEVGVVAGVPNVAPSASFTVDVEGLTVTVDASGSSDSDGDIVGYAWDFGDDGEGQGVSASHDYTASGTYVVTLVVTDDAGATDTRAAEVDVAAEPQSGVVVARDAEWHHYYGPDAPAVDWNDVDGAWSGWSAGRAPLGFGFDGVVTDIDVDGPTSDRPRAAFFAGTFSLTDPARVTGLRLETVANDGVVVYVNGVEVGRHNMPAGTVTHLTFASSSRRVAAANADPVVIDVPIGLLVEGTNVIAASTHLAYRNTPDVSFDLEAQLTVTAP